ncbi:hypothetical protein [Cryptosporangium aurantiacum]|uniref:PH domain-containing protein n=1 Tax=Cryptosporangium aurantiacum TaxID=134849 RepID=A0A1M7RKF9_9ACTN|nr:hypothetical protein [Cryptosporangium aurantiacum]SHN46636.1 hypothetical protein SAMN05443668_11719 [Cryptosporangium aurantiacum]
MADLVRRSRVVALVLGVCGILVGVGIRAAPPHWGSGLGLEVQLAFFLVVIGAAIAGLVLIHVAVFWRSCRSPAPGFLLGRYAGKPAYAAPVTPLFAGPFFISQFMVIGLLLPTWSGLWTIGPVLVPIAAIVIAIVLAVAHVLVLFRPARLRLTTDGLVITTLRSRLVPWDALGPGGPTRHEVHRRVLWLQAHPNPVLGGAYFVDLYGRPPLPGHYWYRLALGDILVDPEFLAHALQTYRDDPGRRAEVGTAEGLDRLVGSPPRSA